MISLKTCRLLNIANIECLAKKIAQKIEAQG